MFRRFYHFFRRQPLFKKVLISLTTGALFCLTAFLSLIAIVWSGLTGQIPDREELSDIDNHVASEIYSADSVLLGRYFIQERSAIQYDDIAPVVIQALIATEDVRFYDHAGIDYRSLWRVLIKSILLFDGSSGGGSTITQQLAKNLYPRKRYLILSVPINKIREAIIAIRLEKIYTKEELLTLYLNTVPFGGNIYGIQTAADRFYSTNAKSLTTDQGAVLIGMLKGTHLYNPRIYPENARARRNVVLGQLKKYNFISAAQADSMVQLPIDLKYNKITHHEGLAPYFRDYIRQELITWCRSHKNSSGKPLNLYTDGLKIYTTIDSRLQRYAEASVKEKMSQLQRQFANDWDKRDPWYRQEHVLLNAIRQSARYKQLMEKGLSHDHAIRELEKPVPLNIFTWEGEKEVTMSPIDSIRHHLKFLNTGFLAMDPSTGHVRAWVGGISHRFFQYDHVKETTKRQVGSVIKPLVYLAALEQGVRPCNYTSARKTTFTNMDNWTPANSDDAYDKKYSMEGALAYSVNTVSIRLLERTGISNVIFLARKMGVTSDIPKVPSIALGTPSISMMEMASVYATIANGGSSVKPMFIQTITDRHGNLLEEFRAEEGQQIAEKENTQLIIHMLKRVVSEGTGAALRQRYGIQNDIAAKTGTTQSNTDGWFIAMSPKLVVASWVGADNPAIRFRSASLGQGAHAALPVVGRFYQLVNKDRDFDELSEAEFPALPEKLRREIDCELFKSDKNLLDKIFGRNSREATREYDERQKSGFFRKLFGK